MKLFLLFLPLNLFGQIWTDTIPDWSDNLAEIKINYVGDWNHMSKGGSYPEQNSAKLFYEFWGFGIDIYTELMPHHSYYILDIDGDVDTIHVQDSRELVDQRTYFNHRLPYGNHKLSMRGGLFVLNKFVKYVDSSPVQPPCYDTISNVVDSVVYRDSIIWETIQVDSIIYKDSIVFHYSDSIIYDTTIVWYRLDSVVYDTVMVPKDSIKWIPTPCPSCEESEPATWKIIALIVTTIMTLFIVLYLTKK
jgi:hypothetical protein